MRKFWIFITVFFMAVSACKIHKKQSSATEKIVLEDVVIKPTPRNTLMYRPMETRKADLLHTELHVSFDYEKEWVKGVATLSFRAWAEPVSDIELDARGFFIESLQAINRKDTLPLAFTYDSLKLHIILQVPIMRTDTQKILIKYIARPSYLDTKGGRAITDTRGLYFINAKGTDPYKPRQIWTQGETEYNSGWFPTIDAPNEKHTQDIYITADSADVTLSNGLLVGSTRNRNGTHTDHWQQLKPHAPYLTMLAVGKFVITRDTWNNKEVSYYLEPAYAPYARTIFGNTPKMIETFSRITGVPYPWDKFSQVVVRDFVSGAMENTTCVVHNEGVQHTRREHIDNAQEGIIVHELFHQWFGDMVTCKSWSHLPLNESFATYGEYLYNEATYGKDFANRNFANNLDAYLRNHAKYNTSPIRHYYENPDDVFDVVSYQKGSWILHRLRAEVGDESFFRGLHRYLTQNAYGTADIHHLRMAMEWASGIDLELFFKQWFEGFGHPDLKAETITDTINNEVKIQVKQVQDSAFGVFNLHTDLTLIWQSPTDPVLMIQTLPIALNSRRVSLQLDIPYGYKATDLKSWWLDADGTIPGVFQENKDTLAWILQLENATSYQPRKRAMKVIGELPYATHQNLQKRMFSWCMARKEFYYLVSGMDFLERTDSLYPQVEAEVIKLTQHEHAEVRDEAMYLLGYKGSPEKVMPFLLAGLKDSSYQVISTCLQAIAISNPERALAEAAAFEKEFSVTIQRTLAWLYANHAGTDKNAYYRSVIGRFGMQRNSILNAYGTYLRRQPAAVQLEGLQVLKQYYALNSDKGKARVMLNLLKNLESKSTEQTVVKGEAFQQFLKEVEAEN